MEKFVNELSYEELEHIQYDWTLWARDDQLPPHYNDWTTWLILGGRGAGKTRAGAEWVRAQATTKK
ncbi:MAG: ATP-binding protein, partial [Methyloligellaceae bacterium]